MDLHNINTTCPCRYKKGGVPSEEKRMICKGLWAVFLASWTPPSGKCVGCVFMSLSRWIKFFSVVVIHLFEEVKAESKNMLNEYIKQRAALWLNILNL